MFFGKKNKKITTIAEIGINHNGNYDNAIKLINSAKNAEFTAVKFQTFIPEEMTHIKTKLAKYQKKTKFKNMQEMLKNYNFSFEQFYKLKKYCEKIKIEFLSTPFDVKSAIFLNDIGVKTFKISSGDLDNFILLSEIKKFGKPMIISTGMGTNKEIIETINFLNLPKSNLAILHCISDYPTELKNTFFSNFDFLKKFKYDIGFSDHTIGDVSSSIAIALGANIIEKHITIDTNLEGPDHACSMPIGDLKKFITTLHSVKKSISTKRKLTSLEKKTLKVARKSLHYSRNLKKGAVIKSNDLAPLRPANNNISPKNFKNFIGKKLKKNKNKYSNLKKSDF